MRDYEFLKYARAVGVTSVGIVKSWDVLTMKGYIPVPLDYYLVWNQIMKQEITRLHHVPQDRLGVTGIPQFDIYAKRSGAQPRDDFLNKLGLDPAKKTILFATSAPAINPDDPEILRQLAIALEERGALAQILARVHHQDSLERYHGITHSNLAFQVPGSIGRVLNASDAHLVSSGDKRLFEPNFLEELRDTLLHSDVVLNTASTMSLDAIAMDKPVVNIAFDLEPKGYYKSCRRYYDFDHYQPIVESGATRIAKSFDEFVSLIMRYLDNPGLESLERSRLRNTMCYKLDGRSVQRVADSLFCILDEKPLSIITGQA
jgi:CDP-glycerol glycerophosphotransferase (TagB/SpsB family)